MEVKPMSTNSNGKIENDAKKTSSTRSHVFYVHIDITIHIHIYKDAKSCIHVFLMLRRVGRNARGVFSRVGSV